MSKSKSKGGFDPSKPFEVLDEPQSPGGFDPNKPFDVIEDDYGVQREGEGFMDAVSRFGAERDAQIAAQPKDKYNAGAAKIMGAADVGGYLPQLQAVFRPGLKNIYEYYTGEKVPDQTYIQSRDKNIEELQKYKDAHPGDYTQGQIFGTVASSLALPSPALGAVSKIPMLANPATSLLGKAAQAGLKGAVVGGEYGLLANPGDVKGEVSPIQPGKRIEKGLEGAREGFKFGAGAQLLGAAAKAAPTAMKKGLTVFFGPSKENIDYYLKNSEAVNSAKSMPEIKAKIDGVIGQLSNDIEQGKISVSNSKKLIKEYQDQIRTLSRDKSLEFKVDQNELNRILDKAKDELEKAYGGKVQTLKDVKSPLELADDTVMATRDLKKKVMEGSEYAKQSLDNNEFVEVFPSFKELEKVKQSMMIGGKAGITKQAKAAINEIEDLRASLGELPPQLTQSDAKKLIQQIDNAKEVVYNSGEFTSDVERAFGQLRHSIDQRLKTANPEYALRMKPVADLTGLHSDVVKKFDDKSAALSTLKSITSPTREVERTNLIRMGKQTGRDFETPIREYSDAQGKLKDPRFLTKLREDLPEYNKMLEVERQAAQMKDPRARQAFIDKELKASGLLDDVEKERAMFDNAQRGLLDAEEKMAPVSSITPLTSENKIKSLMRGNPEEKIELRKQFEALSKLSDTDFLKEIENLRVKDAFQGGRINGSRNVNLFKSIGGGLGTVGGETGSRIGEGIGGAIGGVVDRFGAAIAKKTLDGVIKMGKNPTFQKIKAMDVPPETKQYLMQALIRYKAMDNNEPR